MAYFTHPQKPKLVVATFQGFMLSKCDSIFSNRIYAYAMSKQQLQFIRNGIQTFLQYSMILTCKDIFARHLKFVEDHFDTASHYPKYGGCYDNTLQHVHDTLAIPLRTPPPPHLDQVVVTPNHQCHSPPNGRSSPQTKIHLFIYAFLLGKLAILSITLVDVAQVNE